MPATWIVRTPDDDRPDIPLGPMDEGEARKLVADLHRLGERAEAVNLLDNLADRFPAGSRVRNLNGATGTVVADAYRLAWGIDHRGEGELRVQMDGSGHAAWFRAEVFTPVS